MDCGEGGSVHSTDPHPAGWQHLEASAGRHPRGAVCSAGGHPGAVLPGGAGLPLPEQGGAGLAGREQSHGGLGTLDRFVLFGVAGLCPSVCTGSQDSDAGEGASGNDLPQQLLLQVWTASEDLPVATPQGCRHHPACLWRVVSQVRGTMSMLRSGGRAACPCRGRIQGPPVDKGWGVAAREPPWPSCRLATGEESPRRCSVFPLFTRQGAQGHTPLALPQLSSSSGTQ